MSWLREIKLLIRRLARAEVSRVLTSTVGQVAEYDATRNAVKVRLCVRRMRTEDPANMTTVDLPLLEDVPVQQFGSGKLLASVAPAAGSYGTVLFSDRDLEAWLTTGGVVDPASTRRWDLSDAIFIPGLYPYVVDGDNGQIEEPIKTDRISLRTRSGLTEISVIDDESVEIAVNDGATIVVADSDGNVTITADGDVSVTSGGDVTVTADGNVTTSATETVIQDGADYAVQYTALKSAFDTLKGDFNNFINLTYNLHMHATAAVGAPSVPTIVGVQTAADMSGAKISDVRLP